MLELNLIHQTGSFSLTVAQALPLDGVTAVFGPSGSGKTTLLRLIAGLDKPRSGRIVAAGETWCDTERRVFRRPHQRPVGLVFQGGRLLPHVSVRGNLRYAERRAPVDRQNYGLGDVVDAFDLQTLLQRQPATLSGGERQRVALAQSLLTQPALLLLDEPLAALDQRRKRAILPYLDRLRSEFSIPMLLVSHDVADVTTLADQVLAVDAGQTIDFGPAVEVLNRRGFEIGGGARSGVIVSGEVVDIDQQFGLAKINIGQDSIKLPAGDQTPIGARLRIIVNANDIALATAPPSGLSIQNALRATVIDIQADDQNAFANVRVAIDDTEVPVRITRAAVQSLGLSPGSLVYALIKTAVLAR